MNSASEADKVEQLLRQRLPAWLSAKLRDPSVVLDAVTRLAGGYSNETWRLDFSGPAANIAGRSSLILRWAIPGGVSAPYDIPGQYKLLRALTATGLPVPEPVWLELDTSVIGHQFFTMRSVGGVTVPRVIAKDDPFFTAKLVSYIQAMARIHQIDYRSYQIDQILHEPTPETCATDALTMQVQTAVQYGLSDDPVVKRAIAWARARRPARSSVNLTHGDTNMSNYRYDGPSVVAILDWEAARLSDPLWDLALYLAAIPKFYELEPTDFQLAHRRLVLETYRSITNADYGDLPFWECIHLINATCRSTHPALSGNQSDVYLRQLDELTRN